MELQIQSKKSSESNAKAQTAAGSVGGELGLHSEDMSDPSRGLGARLEACKAMWDFALSTEVKKRTEQVQFCVVDAVALLLDGSDVLSHQVAAVGVMLVACRACPWRTTVRRRWVSETGLGVRSCRSQAEASTSMPRTCAWK